MRGSRDFCQSYFLSLFYSLQRGSNGFIAEKTILILYQGSRGGPLFSRGVSNFFQEGGPNANFFRNPCIVRPGNGRWACPTEHCHSLSI